MKAVVTGGAGFIGSHLANKLILSGFDVHIIDNLESGDLKNVHPLAVFHRLDIRSKEAKQVILKEKPDVVFHLAAQADVGVSVANPSYDASVNVNGTINILEACREVGVKKLIFASTSAVYGDIKADIISENDETNPISFYGASKLCAESYIKLFYSLYKLPYTILRYGNVYGPNQIAKGEGGVIPIFLEKIKTGQPLTVFGDGEQTRDFIYVDDVIKANLAAMVNGNQGTFNISTSTQTSIKKLIESLKQIHGYHIAYTQVNSKKGDIKNSCLNHNKAIRSLEWNPEYDIYRGLTETYTHFMGMD